MINRNYYFYMNNYNLQFVTFKSFGIVARYNISTLKDYVSYTFINTPFPPLNNVPKRGSSL